MASVLFTLTINSIIMIIIIMMLRPSVQTVTVNMSCRFYSREPYADAFKVIVDTHVSMSVFA